MSTINSNTAFTLNGIADFTIGGDVYSWGGGKFIEHVDIWAPDPTTYTLTINLTGSDWYLAALRIGSETNLITVINDDPTGANRKIEYLHLNSSQGSTVTLTHTRAESITGSDAVENITTGSEWVGQISLYGGNDIVTVGTGGSETVNLGDGNNTLNAIGWVSAVLAYDGNDNVSIGSSGSESVSVGNGNNGVTATGFVGAIQAYEGNDVIKTGAGGADTVSAGNGTNAITTGTGWVSAILAYNGTDQVTLGGDVGLVNLGNGNDVYNLRNHFATISDSNGIDTVTSTISRNLTGASNVERLTLLGTNKINGDGNDLNNIITGNNAANKLLGHFGNDTLIGDSGADVLNGGSGADRASYSTATSGVVARLTSPSLNTGDAKGDTYLSIENLSGSNFNDALYGSNGANSISGGNGNDTVIGYGGNDTLTGGVGADRFDFRSALSATTNVDRITDFSVVNDTIRLDNAVMSALGSGIDSGEFWKSTSGLAHDSGDHVIYETDTGKLFYDSNGNAAGGSTHVATLSANLALTYADFLVI